MIYNIVLKDGKEIEGYYENIDNIVEMIFKDNIFIIQENEYPNHITYIDPEKVSYFRFSHNDGKAAKPVI